MNATTPTWDEIAEGQEIPPLTKQPGVVQLFMFSAVTWNRHLIHYNSEYARRDGLPDVATHRALIGNFLAQMLTDWIGEGGKVTKLEWNVRATTVPGTPLVCRGKVLRKREDAGRKCVECEIWVQNDDGEIVAPGKGGVVFFAGGSPRLP